MTALDNAPRILQVLTCDSVGGTEAMLAALLERIDPRQARCELVTLSPPGPVARRVASSGVRVRCLGGRGLAVATARLARLLARERFHVVVAYGFKGTVIVRLLVASLSRRPAFVCGVRGLHVTDVERIDSPKSRAVLALERAGSRLVDAYDANSRGALDLLRRSGVPARKLHYIPNGIDVNRWPTADPGADQGKPPIIACVGRFVGLKRQGDLVAAARLLAASGERLCLLFVGDGPTLPDVRAAATAAGLDGAVDFRGWVPADRLPDVLRSASVFCLCSLWEGMAGSVMEAMAAGLPVVGTRVNGIADLVVHGETGLLVEPERPDELAVALRELMHRPALRRAMGRAGRARVERDFPLERMVRAKQDLYRQLADMS